MTEEVKMFDCGHTSKPIKVDTSRTCGRPMCDRDGEAASESKKGTGDATYDLQVKLNTAAFALNEVMGVLTGDGALADVDSYPIRFARRMVEHAVTHTNHARDIINNDMFDRSNDPKRAVRK